MANICSGYDPYVSLNTEIGNKERLPEKALWKSPSRPDPAADKDLSDASEARTADEKLLKAEPRPSNIDAALLIFGTTARKSM